MLLLRIKYKGPQHFLHMNLASSCTNYTGTYSALPFYLVILFPGNSSVMQDLIVSVEGLLTRLFTLENRTRTTCVSTLGFTSATERQQGTKIALTIDTKQWSHSLVRMAIKVARVVEAALK